MRIGIDTHFVTSASATGNRTYTIEMVNALLELDSCNEYILYAVDENSFYKALADKPNVHVRYVLHPNGLIRNFVSLPRAVAEDRLEVALLQFIMAPYTSVPVVLTIHDLHYVHMQQPSFYEWGIGKLTGWSAHRADHIITLSMYSRRDILRTYALSGDQVTAINAAVNTRFQPMSNHVRLASVKMNCGIDRNYILYVGRTEDPRKNISTLIDAYTKLRQEQKITEQLVIAGRHGPGTAALQEKIHATNSQRDILLPGIISDEDHLLKALVYLF
jgi:glycosyltransferase involved in cell wall biosynthesis